MDINPNFTVSANNVNASWMCLVVCLASLEGP
jgi:hypothetical protein